MRYTSTYVYLAIALGIFCYLALVDKKIPGTDDRNKAEKELFSFDPSDVTSLETDSSRA